jgi:alanyl-tRNA synthetase
MKQLTANEIRKSFLDFFVQRGHALVASDSLVPENDPTLLFTGAGMNQFKDLFIGKGDKPYSRATSSQKCFRTGDLDQVGRSMTHHTFFEMLGNFSFGDYFKREAIGWGWEYLTEVLEIPADRLSATVYLDDDEAYDIWRNEIGLPEERVTRLDAKENFWPANAPEDGPNGVCGPCSEIFFDYGEEHSCGMSCLKEACDCARYSEVYNLVFTQFLRTGPHQLEPLPQKNIDTGLGFERLVAVLREQFSTFATDLFLPIIGRISEISEVPYEFHSPDGVRMRRIADHARAAIFCLVDGVKPGREGREFVLRRVIRRAVRDGIGLGLEMPFLKDLVPVVIEVMGDQYPAVAAGRDEIERLLNREEERFRATYHQGMNALVEKVELLRVAGGTELSGEEAFRLHDERGFPVDLTEDYLLEEGLTLDRAGFETAMEARRKQSQQGSDLEADIFARGPVADLKTSSGATIFTGYDRIQDRGVVVGLIRDDELVTEVKEGEVVMLVADRTPFYAESGGQIGDAGVIEGPKGRLEVRDTRGAEGVNTMIGSVLSGTIALGDEVTLEVDTERRDAIRRNHSATHLLHRALRDRLGKSVTQAGSLVAPDRLRFDFHCDEGLTEEDIAVIEDAVNREILRNTPLSTKLSTPAEARAAGAMALFGEKYGDEVRVVTVGDYSTELCGGTHCGATGEIGSFRIVSESAIGAGLRRVEGLTGTGALERARLERQVLAEAAALLKTRPDDVPTRVAALRDELKELGKKLDQALSSGAGEGPEEQRITLENGAEAVLVRFEGPYEMKHLLAGADDVRKAGGRVAALLLAVGEAGVSLVVAATPDLVKAGFDAGAAVRQVAGAMGGGGGGRPDLGRGKGQSAENLPAGFEILTDLVSRLS